MWSLFLQFLKDPFCVLSSRLTCVDATCLFFLSLDFYCSFKHLNRATSVCDNSLSPVPPQSTQPHLKVIMKSFNTFRNGFPPLPPVLPHPVMIDKHHTSITHININTNTVVLIRYCLWLPKKKIQ